MFAASTTVGRVFRYRNSGMPKNSSEVTKSVAAQCLFVYQGSEVIHRLLLSKAKRTFVRRKRKGPRKIIAVSGVNLFAYFYFLWRTDLLFQQGEVSLDIPALGRDTQLGVERKKKSNCMLCCSLLASYVSHHLPVLVPQALPLPSLEVLG